MLILKNPILFVENILREEVYITPMACSHEILNGTTLLYPKTIYMWKIIFFLLKLRPEVFLHQNCMRKTQGLYAADHLTTRKQACGFVLIETDV